MENTFAQENEKHRVFNGIACYRVPTHLQLQKSCLLT